MGVAVLSGKIGLGVAFKGLGVVRGVLEGLGATVGRTVGLVVNPTKGVWLTST